jgi:hypothetical protein
VTYAPTLVEFRPQVEDIAAAPHLAIRDVTDQKSRTERVAALYSYALERDWRLRRSQAQRQGLPQPGLQIEEIEPAIGAPGHEEGLAIDMELTGRTQRQLLYFVQVPDGRRFRVDYIGVDPGFTEHRDAVTASLASLRFADAEEPEFSLPATVAALQEHLDGDRLWLDDGQVDGQRLHDRHMEALRDPAFAGVTDLNLISGPAATSGVDVTDEGLAYITHLPLQSLIVRGSLVTDAGLAQLAGLELESLVLGETLIEGEGLRHLRGMPLRSIDLGGTRVGDESLQYLIGMPLISVNLRGTRVSDTGFALLEREFPGAYINR